MADRWMDDREDWRERERRTQRYGRDEDYGSSDYERRDYALGDYDTGYRSFQPRDYDRGQRPVFGERETGADYTGPRYGAGGYTGYGDRGGRGYAERGYGGRDYGGRDYGGRDYGDQNFRARSSYGRNEEGGGRYYGDDGRSNLYRGELTTSSPSDRSYSDYRTQRAASDRDFGSDRAYGGAYGGGYRGDYDGGRYERDRDERDRGGNFWSRASQRVASWFGEFDDDDRRETRHGGHRGRGPQGYKRSDERISDEAHERLTDDPWVDATNITISVSGGEITLSGTVEQREAKHRAERIVEDISGVHHVQNNIRVERGNPLTSSGRGFGDSASQAQMRTEGQSGTAGDGDLTLSSGAAKGSSRAQ